MGTPFLGEIKAVPFDFAPRGWALCDGQLLPINANQALFSLLGTQYGGDGRTTFALPDLRGRTPVHAGGAWPAPTVGQKLGQESVTLISPQLPSHTHAVSANAGAATTAEPDGAVWAAPAGAAYAASGASSMHPSTVTAAGANQPHDNMPPFLTLNFVIATSGVFPSRD